MTVIMLLSFSSNSFLQTNGKACKVDGRQQVQVTTPVMEGGGYGVTAIFLSLWPMQNPNFPISNKNANISIFLS